MIREETVSARYGLVPMLLRAMIRRAIPRGARAYCREDFPEDVVRRNINTMVCKLSSVCIPIIYVKVYLSTCLKGAMKVRMIKVIWMSAVVFFRTNPVAKTR